jgi:proteasome lid subunit RPN8/RPN11
LFSFGLRRSWAKPATDVISAPGEAITEVTEPKEKDGEPVFIVTSLMLHDCFKALTRTSDEGLHAVTGSTLGNVRSLERMIPLSLSAQSPGSAVADDESVVDRFLHLYEYGLRPLAYFHSHPGCGLGATLPSRTDRQTQANLEQSGSDIIGGIFSRDGFVQFYSNRRKPDVRVVGKRVRKVGKNAYKLESEEDIPE